MLCLAALLISTNFTMGVTIFPLVNLFIFLTNIVMLLTCVCVLMALKNSQSWSRSSDKISTVTLTFTHILFEITTLLNCLVIGVYWSMLHPIFIARCEGRLEEILHMYFVHSFPTVCLFLVYLSTERLIMNETHIYKLIQPMLPIMVIQNYAATMAKGSPIYWFLDW